MFSGEIRQIVRIGLSRFLHGLFPIRARGGNHLAAFGNFNVILAEFFLINEKSHQRRAGHQREQMRRVGQSGFISQKINTLVTLIPPQAIAGHRDNAAFAQEIDAFNQGIRRFFLLRRDHHPDAAFGQRFLLDMLHLLFVFGAQIQHDRQTFFVECLRGQLPVADVRHQQNRAGLFLHRLFQIFPALPDIFNGFLIKADEAMNIDIGKLVILLPRAPQMIKKSAVRKQSPVKPEAVGHAHRKEKIITGRDKPRKYPEKPQPQPPG